MQDTKVFETILGIQAPWRTSLVALHTSGEPVDLWAEHAKDTRWPCPECVQAPPCRDHVKERDLRLSLLKLYFAVVGNPAPRT